MDYTNRDSEVYVGASSNYNMASNALTGGSSWTSESADLDPNPQIEFTLFSWQGEEKISGFSFNIVGASSITWSVITDYDNVLETAVSY